MIKTALSIPSVLKVKAGSKIPLRVTHMITYNCNLDCSYCSRHYDTNELGTQDVMDLMKSFREAGTRFWSFNGGEALMRDDLGELITYGRKLGFITSLATNGTLVAERINDLRDIDMVTISLDGPRKIQEESRPGSFDKIIEGMDALDSNNIQNNIMTVIGKHNINVLDDVLGFAEAYGTRVFFQPIRVQKEDTEGKSKMYFPTPDQMREATTQLINAKKQVRPVASSTKYLEHMRDCWPDKMPAEKCWAGRISCAIDPSGHVAPCCDTLASCAGREDCNAGKNGAQSFHSIPDFKCSTCYSSIPLETNIMMNHMLKPKFAHDQILREYLLHQR
ncbi:MAG: radical SAM protein [Candidatus Altiarchaeales archaeon]|nr:radical SAM protein [Candidatus Altiarchaeales archaeon]MBD3416453.1 radical SAM protein [Candidatus Altiarchaeales archaeon]